MKKLMRCGIPAALAALCLTAWGVRVYQLNAGIEKLQTVRYAMGEQVEFGDDYYYHPSESLAGYDITVQSATLMSYRDFVEAHGETVDYMPEESRPYYVYDIVVLLHNKNTEANQTAGISFIDMALETTDDFVQVNNDLFALLYPDLEGAMGYALRPDSSAIMHMPYAFGHPSGKKWAYEEILSKNWYLRLSLYPTKKLIAVTES